MKVTQSAAVVLVVSGVLLASGGVSLCAPIYVDQGVAGAGEDGASWATAYRDLQAALSADAAGTAEVWVASGTYVPGNTPTSKFALKDRTIRGGFAGTETSPDQRPGDPRANPTILSGNLGGGIFVRSGIMWKEAEGHAVLDRLILEDGGSYVDGIFDGSRPGCGGALYAPGFYSPGSLRIQDCVFRNHRVDSYGGALYLQIPTEIVRSDFINNVCGQGLFGNGVGGAIFLPLSARSLTLDTCNFVSNSCPGSTYYSPMTQRGGLGGADIHFNTIYYDHMINDCTFGPLGAPGAGHGGSIAVYQEERLNGQGQNNATGSVSIVGCTFRACTTFGNGGAVHVEGDESAVDDMIVITKTRFLDCWAAKGGAVSLGVRNARIENCEFTRNLARLPGGGGGAVYLSDGDVEITYCTFYTNGVQVSSGTGQGGQVLRESGRLVAANPTLDIVNSIFNGGTVPVGGSGSEMYVNDGIANVSYSLVDPSDTAVGPADAINLDDASCISGDPRFVDPGNDVFFLLTSSPARNAGAVIAGIGDDILGAVRDATPNMGAYELRAPVQKTGLVLMVR